jgi:predicted phosphodiesterase
MRTAILSDIHGNRTAFEAVLADLRGMAPDLVLHGGDLADAGSSPNEIIDQICDLGWEGVAGNTDEMLAVPATFETFAAHSPQLASLWSAVRAMAAVTRERLGQERLAWLRELPRMQRNELALVHATAETTWRAPAAGATDDVLADTYAPFDRPVAVYGHIHIPFVRRLPGLLVANCGSVGMPHDGDPRASYLLVDDTSATIRRVAYDVEKEVRALAAARLPHHEWVARILRTARPQPVAA